jgi:DNA double-strand break repair helicase HerA and related ATPase
VCDADSPEPPPADDDDKGAGKGKKVAGAAAGGAVGGMRASPVFRTFARSAASAAGREISRSLFGTSRRRRC